MSELFSVFNFEMLSEDVDSKIMAGIVVTDSGLIVEKPWSKSLQKGDRLVCLAADV